MGFPLKSFAAQSKPIASGCSPIHFISHDLLEVGAAIETGGASRRCADAWSRRAPPERIPPYWSRGAGNLVARWLPGASSAALPDSYVNARGASSSAERSLHPHENDGSSIAR